MASGREMCNKVPSGCFGGDLLLPRRPTPVPLGPKTAQPKPKLWTRRLLLSPVELWRAASF